MLLPSGHVPNRELTSGISQRNLMLQVKAVFLRSRLRPSLAVLDITQIRFRAYSLTPFFLTEGVIECRIKYSCTRLEGAKSLYDFSVLQKRPLFKIGKSLSLASLQLLERSQ